jgi:Predicted transcriptional regulators
MHFWAGKGMPFPALHVPVDERRHSCHIARVTLSSLKLKPGQSIFDQVVFAAIKAFIGGEYRPGQVFPSVRALAADLKIHPNTAHKVVQHLVQAGWLEVRPGVGTVVATPPEPRPGDRKRLLQQEVEALVVEALRVGLKLDDVVDAVSQQWAALEKPQSGGRK